VDDVESDDGGAAASGDAAGPVEPTAGVDARLDVGAPLTGTHAAAPTITASKAIGRVREPVHDVIATGTSHEPTRMTEPPRGRVPD